MTEASGERGCAILTCPLTLPMFRRGQGLSPGNQTEKQTGAAAGGLLSSFQQYVRLGSPPVSHKGLSSGTGTSLSPGLRMHESAALHGSLALTTWEPC